jgi:hypothetical protein
MDWLNLHTSIIDSPEATLSDPVRRATWVWLLRFCIGQENGGRITGCKSWGDTTWQQMARVRLREVRLKTDLYSWDGDDLVVTFYPAEKQAEVQSKRKNGALGGRPAKPSNNHVVMSRFDSAETEGKGREGKGREGEGELAPPQPDLFGPDQPTPPRLEDSKPKNLGEFQALHPRIHIGQGEREGWTAILRLWGWNPCAHAYRESVKQLRDRRHRVLLSMLTKFLDENYDLPKESA